MTAASPQAAAGSLGKPHSIHGWKFITEPNSACSAARSRSQFCSTPRGVVQVCRGRREDLDVAAPARAARRAAGSRWAGRRSCRACSRRRSGGSGRAAGRSLENQPVRGMSEWTTSASTIEERPAGRQAAHLRVAEAVEREPRCPGRTARRRGECTRRRRPRCAAGASPARRSRAPRRGGARSREPAEPATPMRTLPEMFWPKSTRMRPSGRVRISTGAKHVDHPDRGTRSAPRGLRSTSPPAGCRRSPVRRRRSRASDQSASSRRASCDSPS